MYNFEISRQGAASYLVLRLQENDVVDNLALGMLRYNQIPGLLPMDSRWEKNSYAFYYNISSLTPLSHCYQQLANEKRLMRFLRDYCGVVKECAEYLLDAEGLYLDDEYIYVKTSTGEMFAPYIALQNRKHSYDAYRDFDHFAHRILDYLAPENKIGNLLMMSSFRHEYNPSGILKAIDAMETVSEHPIGPVRQTVQQKRPMPAKQKTPPQHFGNVIDIGAGEAPLQSRQNIVPPSSRGADVAVEVPPATSNVQQERGPEESKAKKKWSLFGKKDKNKSVSIATESPFAPSGDLSVEKNKKRSVPEKGNKELLEPAGPAHSNEGIAESLQSNKVVDVGFSPAYAPAAAESGYTINLNGLNSGVSFGTVLMPDNEKHGSEPENKKPTLWLVRRGTEQEIQITHSNFHVGRMIQGDEVVDFAVMTKTGFMGADHAYFTIRDDELFLTDNNSTNGTWINNEKLFPSQPKAVRPGDVVRMADEYFDIIERI